MARGFQYTAYDRKVYEKELKDFLPNRIFDAHVHVSTSGLQSYGSHNGGSTWMDHISQEMDVKNFLAINKQLFPEQKTEALIFGACLTNIEQTNKFTIECNREYNFPMLSDDAQ